MTELRGRSTRAYADTDVAVETSQRDIRALLRRHGADHFAFAESREQAELAFTYGRLAVRMRVPIRPMTREEMAEHPRLVKKGLQKMAAQADELEARRVWRVLWWLLKGRMEAIAAGVETFEEAFLAHLLNSDTGQTVYEALVDAGAMHQLGAGEPARA